MVAYGFEQLNLNLIYLTVMPHNARAHNLYLDLGFREEGRLRARMYRDGGYSDLISLSLLREEWLAH